MHKIFFTIHKQIFGPQILFEKHSLTHHVVYLWNGLCATMCYLWNRLHLFVDFWNMFHVHSRSSINKCGVGFPLGLLLPIRWQDITSYTARLNKTMNSVLRQIVIVAMRCIIKLLSSFLLLSRVFTNLIKKIDKQKKPFSRFEGYMKFKH